MKGIVKRFKIVSVMRIAAFLGFITGIISGIISIIFWVAVSPFTTVIRGDPNFYGNLIVNNLLISPIFSAMFMIIAAAIVFGLYNFFSKRIGGIEINLNSRSVAKNKLE